MAIAQLSPFARLFRRYRLEVDLTQERLAERAGLSARAISDLERRARTRPHRVTVELLADALHLTSENRDALLAAIPRTTDAQAGVETPLPDWLFAGLEPRSLSAHPVQCSQELRRVLDGLVGLYVNAEGRERQINITLFMFSVGERVTVE